ncbi:MAG: hypothetical protein K0S42_3004, partial [Microvirga sp.]|nr:hypothetical protein [Microvirga sp.]
VEPLVDPAHGCGARSAFTKISKGGADDPRKAEDALALNYPLELRLCACGIGNRQPQAWY